jgi:hypothetical protein
MPAINRDIEAMPRLITIVDEPGIVNRRRMGTPVVDCFEEYLRFPVCRFDRRGLDRPNNTEENETEYGHEDPEKESVL